MAKRKQPSQEVEPDDTEQDGDGPKGLNLLIRFDDMDQRLAFKRYAETVHRKQSEAIIHLIDRLLRKKGLYPTPEMVERNAQNKDG